MKKLSHRSNIEETNSSDVFCAIGHRLSLQSQRKIQTLGLICDDCDARGGSKMYELHSESSSTFFDCAHCWKFSVVVHCMFLGTAAGSAILMFVRRATISARKTMPQRAKHRRVHPGRQRSCGNGRRAPSNSWNFPFKIQKC